MAKALRSSTLDPFFLNLDTLYQRGYMAGETTYEQWSQQVTSTSTSTVHGWLDKFPKLREWLPGPRQIETYVTQSYTLKNKRFELSGAIQVDDLDDDQYGLYAPAAEMAGMQSREWPDDQLTPVLEAGNTATTFDGAAFFSASHPTDTATPGSANQSNLFTSSAFSATTASNNRASMRKFKGRDGKPLGMNMKAVMGPPALESAMLQAANAEFIVATFGINANSGSQTNVLRGSFTPIINAKLTSDTTWYGFDNRWPLKAMIWQLRMAPRFTLRVSPTDENVAKDDQYEWYVKARGVGGYGLWFMAFQATA
jgi:phage major head subunit gpT-like protein